MHRARNVWSGFAILLCFTAIGAACGDKYVVTTPSAVVVVTPATAQLVSGDTVRLRAQSRPTSCGCRWSTADPTVAVIDATGLVRAVAPGRAVITAFLERYPEVRSSALIEVTAP